MEQKKYIDIERCKQRYAETFKVGEQIVVQVKIDGSNASIAYDENTNSLVAFSRRQELSEKNNLNGFWNFVQTLDVSIFKEILGNRYIIFGEWLTPHAVKYPQQMYNKFYMFDVWDKVAEEYLPQEKSFSIFKKLQPYITEYVNTLYSGDFISWDALLNLLKENTYGESPCMEGIVIKRQNCLDSKSSRLPFYVKIVSEQFSEVHKSKKQKAIDPDKMAVRAVEMEKVATIVTPQRIEKMMFKLIDEQIFPQDWDEKNMKDISRVLPKRIWEDIVKEEPETIQQCKNASKIANQLVMKHIRTLLNKKS